MLSRLFIHDTRCTHLGLFTFPYQNTVLESQNHPNAEGHSRRDDDGGTGQAFAAGQEVPSLSSLTFSCPPDLQDTLLQLFPPLPEEERERRMPT